VKPSYTLASEPVGIECTDFSAADPISTKKHARPALINAWAFSKWMVRYLTARSELGRGAKGVWMPMLLCFTQLNGHAGGKPRGGTAA
jgi:hypothetical protein